MNLNTVTLVVPDLIPPVGGDDLLPRLALETLLGKGTLTARAQQTPADWVLARHGAPGSSVADLTRRVQLATADDGHWLRADPVHLRPDRDRVVLYGPEVLGLSADEAAQLVSTLNAQFGEDGLQFYAATPDCWYVRLAEPSAIGTTPLEQVRGSDMHPYLPRGDNALRWHRLLNEIQMLLYTHPVNDARDMAGRPAANSVWLWGEGATGLPVDRAFDHVVADDALPVGLAAASGASVQSASSAFDWSVAHGRTLLWLDGAAPAVARADFDAWQAAVIEIDQRWGAPVRDAWQAGRINVVELVTGGAGWLHTTTASRNDRWKFWRPPRPLASLRRVAAP